MSAEHTAQQAASPAPGRGKLPPALRALLRLLLKLAVIAAAVWALLSFVLGLFLVHSNAMYPAVRDGDLVITYRLRSPARGDIVAYEVGGVRRLGRVVGLEGDEINMDQDGNFTVNGLQPYDTIYYATAPAPGADIHYPFIVPAGEMFVLNDLRDDVDDSRSFGSVPLDETDGSAALLLRRRSW